ALHQPRARRHLTRRAADEHLRDRLSDHARCRPRRRARDAADDGSAVHDGAREDARAVPVSVAQCRSRPRERTMSDVTAIRDPRTDWLLTPQNAVLALIDYQPEQYAGVSSIG